MVGTVRVLLSCSRPKIESGIANICTVVSEGVSKGKSDRLSTDWIWGMKGKELGVTQRLGFTSLEGL